MADMPGFGTMDIADRGGAHDLTYSDGRATPATPGPTPSQTVGPFFAYGLTPGPYGYALPEMHRTDLAGPDVPGERITIEGYIFDATGGTVHDAVVEVVQADANGTYATRARNDGFTGFGRAGTGATGSAQTGGDTRYLFRTIRPGATGAGCAPFITMTVFMRGLMNHCVTRLYFPEDAPHTDPVLDAVPAARRDTLIAERVARGQYRFDIHMRGDRETVFFDI